MKSSLIMLARYSLVITGILLLILCAGFLSGHPSVLGFWPWPDVRLSYVLIASTLAAIGAPIIWLGLSGELAAVRGGALGFAVAYTGLAVTLLIFGSNVSEVISVNFFLALTVAAALLNMLLFLLVLKSPIKDDRPVSWLLRASFMVFFLLLIAVGIALINGYQAVFPWPLKPLSSVVFGWLFMGAAFYFFYGFLQPNWGNMCGQLIGLLAYDLVLLAPFIQHLSAVKAEHQLSLYIYTAVLLYSALLSVYFLLLHPTTRFGSRQENYEDSWS